MENNKTMKTNDLEFMRLSVARQKLNLSKSTISKITRSGQLKRYYIDGVRVPYVKIRDLNHLFPGQL